MQQTHTIYTDIHLHTHTCIYICFYLHPHILICINYTISPVAMIQSLPRRSKVWAAEGWELKSGFWFKTCHVSWHPWLMVKDGLFPCQIYVEYGGNQKTIEDLGIKYKKHMRLWVLIFMRIQGEWSSPNMWDMWVNWHKLTLELVGKWYSKQPSVINTQWDIFQPRRGAAANIDRLVTHIAI